MTVSPPLTQLIYVSEPFGYDSAMLAGILAGARRANPLLGITGALICRQDIYLQLIEGEAAAIDQLYERIAVDDRHLAVTLLSRDTVERRMFPDWAMLDDPARSWIWTPAQVSDGAVRAATPAQLRDIFARVAREVAPAH